MRQVYTNWLTFNQSARIEHLHITMRGLQSRQPPNSLDNIRKEFSNIKAEDDNGTDAMQMKIQKTKILLTKLENI